MLSGEQFYEFHSEKRVIPVLLPEFRSHLEWLITCPVVEIPALSQGKINRKGRVEIQINFYTYTNSAWENVVVRWKEFSLAFFVIFHVLPVISMISKVNTAVNIGGRVAHSAEGSPNVELNTYKMPVRNCNFSKAQSMSFWSEVLGQKLYRNYTFKIYTLKAL